MEVMRRKNTVTFELKDKVFAINIDEATELYNKLSKVIDKDVKQPKEKKNGSRQRSLSI